MRPDAQPAASPPTIPATASISAPVTSTAPGTSSRLRVGVDAVGRQGGPGGDEHGGADRER